MIELSDFANPIANWLAITLFVTVIVVALAPFVFERDDDLGHGAGVDRLRNSDGDLPFEGIRVGLAIVIFVIPCAIAGYTNGGLFSALGGAGFGGSFVVWIAALQWWDPM